MRHKLLPATTALLWILNGVIVAAEAAGLPHLDEFDSGQRVLAIATVAVTVAWILNRRGIEYRIGYRHGRNDRDDK